MCNESCMAFGRDMLGAADVRGKRVLEVGSVNVNGNLRAGVSAHGPKEYIGVDIEPGQGVDMVCKAEDIVEKFGRDSFDLVITTEMLEHVRDWRKVVSNLKAVCRPGGLILLTTRSKGFKYHGFPYDFWRFELSDMRTIFADCEIISLQPDALSPGVLLKARKPVDFKEADLSGLALYSIVTDRKNRDLKDEDFDNLHFNIIRGKIRFRDFRTRVKKRFFSLLGAGRGN